MFYNLGNLGSLSPFYWSISRYNFSNSVITSSDRVISLFVIPGSSCYAPGKLSREFPALCTVSPNRIEPASFFNITNICPDHPRPTFRVRACGSFQARHDYILHNDRKRKAFWGDIPFIPLKFLLNGFLVSRPSGGTGSRFLPQQTARKSGYSRHPGHPRSWRNRLSRPEA